MEPEDIEKELDIGPGTSLFLSQMFGNINQMRKYIDPKITDLTSPALLPNINHFTDLVLLSIDNGDGLFVWGHDDIDGHTATTIMVKTLSLLNARVDYHIPNKQKEGYIIPHEWLEKLKKDKFNTIITVDFGSSSPLNFKHCQEAGIQFLVTDHHQVIYPKGVQINPKMPDSKYPEKNIAGAGVSLMVAQYLATNILGISVEEFYELNSDFLALALLGTIADRIPLKGDNRTIALLGLEELKKSGSPWVKILRRETSNYNQIISVAFPILASARGKQGVQFFLSKNTDQVQKLFNQFKEAQEAWQAGYSRYLPMVLKSAKVYPEITLAIVPDLSVEYLGSFANRLKDEFQRTAMVVAKNNDNWTAELRGSAGIDLVQEIKRLKDHLIDFGGHPQACGLSFPEQSLESVTEGMVRISDSFNKNKKQFKLVDLDLPINKIENSLKKIFPLPDKIRFKSRNSHVNNGQIDNKKVVWNITPPDDGYYHIIYSLDTDLNIYVKEAVCQQ